MRRGLLLLPLLALLAAPALFALEVPPAPTQWFTDRANIINETQGALLNKKLADFEQSSGAQFIIYVFPSIERESIEDFTLRCVERWKVGQSKYDNGLVLFVFLQEKKIRIETGYGLEGAITDAFSATVIREVIAPRFRDGDYYAGLNAGADAVMAKIRGEEAPVAPLNPRADGAQQQAPRSGGFDIIQALIVLFVIFFVVLPMVRRGGGSGCALPLFLLGGGGGRGITFGGGRGGGFGGGGGGFSGGGGSFGGGGATGGW